MDKPEEQIGKEIGGGSIAEVKGLREAIDFDIENVAPMIFTVVKKFTAGEAIFFVRTGFDGDGFQAYKTLISNYLPSLAHNEGQVSAAVSAMCAMKARRPADMRKLLAELAIRLRRYTEVIGEPYPLKVVKSYVVNMCDPETAKYITPFTHKKGQPTMISSQGLWSMSVWWIMREEELADHRRW